MLSRLIWWTPELCLSSDVPNLEDRWIVAHIRAANPEDDIFRDVGGVVADALQVAGDDQRVQRLRRQLGFSFISELSA